MTNQINDLLKESLDAVKNLVDTSIVVGNKIVMDDITVIPISKVKYGFISGGCDQVNNPFVAGNAGTVSMTPIALIVSNHNDVKILHLDSNTHTYEYLVDNIVDIIHELKNKIKKQE